MTTELEPAPQQHAAPPGGAAQQQQQGDAAAAAALQERVAWASRMRAQFSPEGINRPDGSLDQVGRGL